MAWSRETRVRQRLRPRRSDTQGTGAGSPHTAQSHRHPGPLQAVRRPAHLPRRPLVMPHPKSRASSRSPPAKPDPRTTATATRHYGRRGIESLMPISALRLVAVPVGVLCLVGMAGLGIDARDDPVRGRLFGDAPGAWPFSLFHVLAGQKSQQRHGLLLGPVELEAEVLGGKDELVGVLHELRDEAVDVVLVLEVARRAPLNVQPTIKVPAGYKFTVRVNRDILFEAPYEPVQPATQHIPVNATQPRGTIGKN